MPLRIASADHDRAILVCDDEHNDVAEFYHADQATVGQSYETAYGYANRLISHDALVKALEAGRPAIENLSTCQEQCDFDGIMVKVSRQAVEETLDVIRAFKATLASSLCEQEGRSP
jgi:hypothetical protein